MIRPYFALSLILFVLLSATPAVHAAGRPLSTEDFFRIQEVHDPQVSPDGLMVAYLVSHNDQKADERQTVLWIVGWDGSDPIQVTREGREVSAPRFSPDGRYLAFLSTVTGSDENQLMLFDRRGGEPRQLTTVKGDISSFAWSPDSRRLVIAMDDDATAGGAADKGEDGKIKAPLPIVIDGRHFKEDTEGYLTAKSIRHLYLVDASSGALSQLTNDAGHNDELPRWSPDGSQIAFVRTVERATDADGMQAIELIEAHAGASLHTVTRIFAPNRQQLEWTPDGRQIALLVGLPPRFNAYISDRLAIVPTSGGAMRLLSNFLDRAVVAYVLAPDGKAFDALIEDDRQIYPLRLALDGTTPERLLAQGEGGVTIDIATAAGHTAVLLATDQRAPEVHALEHGKLRKLTHHNDVLLSELELGSVEDLSFKSRDGTEVHGLLIKPAGYVAGRKYPTILWIHGGPNGEDDHSLLFDGYPLALERQLLAAQGYIVLAVNYRGSSGRGGAFQQAILADWGHKEVEDLLASVDHVVALGIADASRLGIGGWSYGGLLTDYTIASDTRFKAAVSGAGSANQLALYGSDEYILQEDSEFGPPWKSLATWLKVSYPFYHADRIKTPTLFMGGEKDFNVPITGGEQLYMALRTLGIPTRLVIYPAQYHILTRPSYIKDRAERILEWYARFLQPTSATPAL
jgi:dipeptidyl aminopeptidase/acylaminoacyl peptidase